MRFMFILIFAAACSWGNELSELAKSRGLKAIPQQKAELEQLIANPANPFSPEKLELGKMLYFDPRLSKSGLISCNTCHNLALGGVDGVAAAIGHQWAANPHHLNSPTVYNSVFNIKQFWDGRSPDLEDQAQGPIQAGPEMSMDQETAVKVVATIPEYVAAFQKAFPKEANPVTFANIAKAIGAFERTLVTPAPFDAFLHGDEKALNEQQQRGLQLFVDKGCTTCHNGIGVGGTMMQKFPLIGTHKYMEIGDYKGDANGLTKVPLLRNITETAPYLHNGATFDLKEVVQIMGKHQLNQEISDAQADDIVAFLGSLTGEKPSVTYPILPPRTANTPKPQVH